MATGDKHKGEKVGKEKGSRTNGQGRGAGVGRRTELKARNVLQGL